MAETEEQAREQLNTGTKDVAESHRFDEAALARWMAANVEGYVGPLEVRQFKGGQSNPTYQLVTPGKKYVLRRKPPGKLLPLGPCRGSGVQGHHSPAHHRLSSG